MPDNGSPFCECLMCTRPISAKRKELVGFDLPLKVASLSGLHWGGTWGRLLALDWTPTVLWAAHFTQSLNTLPNKATWGARRDWAIRNPLPWCFMLNLALFVKDGASWNWIFSSPLQKQ